MALFSKSAMPGMEDILGYVLVSNQIRAWTPGLCMLTHTLELSWSGAAGFEEKSSDTRRLGSLLGSHYNTAALTDTKKEPLQPGRGGLVPHLGTLTKSSVSSCKGLKFMLGR